MKLFAPDAAGHGTDAVINAYHRLGGRIRTRIPLVKTVASAFTLGTGGSVGREVQSRRSARVSVRSSPGCLSHRSANDACWCSPFRPGLGAIFRSPLGAALFTSEMLYRDMDFEANALVPSFVASIVSYSIYCAVTDKWGAVFVVPQVKFNHVVELPFYVALGLICAVVGILYTKRCMD